MNIFLVRHGTTDWNAKGMIQGRTDTDLDPIGIEMAEQSGRKLSSLGIVFDRAYTSPLARAAKTAELLAPYLKAIPDPRLIELSFGKFEGQTVSKMQSDPLCAFRYFRSYPDLYDSEVRKLPSEDNYETLTDLCTRAASFMKEVIEPAAADLPGDANILISGHGALNRALLMYIEGVTDLHDFWGSGLSDNCGITKISCTREEGAITFRIQEESRIYYDPKLREKISVLL